MKTLRDLNADSNKKISFTDDRDPQVIYDRESADNQTSRINEGAVAYLAPGIEIEDIVQYEDLNLTVTIAINATVPNYNGFSYDNLPSYMNVDLSVPDTITVGGFRDVDDWVWAKENLGVQTSFGMVTDWSYTVTIDTDISGAFDHTYTVSVQMVDIQFMTVTDFTYQSTIPVDWQDTDLISALNTNAMPGTEYELIIDFDDTVVDYIIDVRSTSSLSHLLNYSNGVIRIVGEASDIDNVLDQMEMKIQYQMDLPFTMTLGDTTDSTTDFVDGLTMVCQPNNTILNTTIGQTRTTNAEQTRTVPTITATATGDYTYTVRARTGTNITSLGPNSASTTWTETAIFSFGHSNYSTPSVVCDDEGTTMAYVLGDSQSVGLYEGTGTSFTNKLNISDSDIDGLNTIALSGDGNVLVYYADTQGPGLAYTAKTYVKTGTTWNGPYSTEFNNSGIWIDDDGSHMLVGDSTTGTYNGLYERQTNGTWSSVLTSSSQFNTSTTEPEEIYDVGGSDCSVVVTRVVELSGTGNFTWRIYTSAGSGGSYTLQKTISVTSNPIGGGVGTLNRNGTAFYLDGVMYYGSSYNTTYTWSTTLDYGFVSNDASNALAGNEVYVSNPYGDGRNFTYKDYDYFIKSGTSTPINTGDFGYVHFGTGAVTVHVHQFTANLDTCFYLKQEGSLPNITNRFYVNKRSGFTDYTATDTSFTITGTASEINAIASPVRMTPSGTDTVVIEVIVDHATVGPDGKQQDIGYSS